MHREQNAQQIQQQTNFYFASTHGRSSFARIGACLIMVKAANNLSNHIFVLVIFMLSTAN